MLLSVTSPGLNTNCREGRNSRSRRKKTTKKPTSELKMMAVCLSCKQTVLWFHPSAAAGGRFLCSLDKAVGAASSELPTFAQHAIQLPWDWVSQPESTRRARCWQLKFKRRSMAFPFPQQRKGDLRLASAGLVPPRSVLPS